MSDIPPKTEIPDADPDANLVKVGEDVDLTNRVPGLRNISIRAGWDAKSYNGGDVDVDISLIFLNAKDQTIRDQDFIFYNNAEAFEGAVQHHGDSRHGAGAGDDEEITIDLQGIPFDYIKCLIVISIYRGGEFDQNLGDIRNGFVRIVNEEDGKQLVRYKIDEDIAGHEETAMVAAELERIGSQWTFRPLAQCDEGGLAAIASRHGLIIANQ